jgi:hypothetical protein
MGSGGDGRVLAHDPFARVALRRRARDQGVRHSELQVRLDTTQAGGGEMSEPTTAANEAERKAAYDHSDCPNGPDEHGNYPCDPQVLLGGGQAECQTCGRIAAWQPPTYNSLMEELRRFWRDADREQARARRGLAGGGMSEPTNGDSVLGVFQERITND